MPTTPNDSETPDSSYLIYSLESGKTATASNTAVLDKILAALAHNGSAALVFSEPWASQNETKVAREIAKRRSDQ